MRTIIVAVSHSGDPKRILFVSPFDEPVSGADESLLLLIQQMDPGRFEPWVLLPEASHYRDRYQEFGAKVVTWPLSRMRRNYSPLFWMKYLVSLRRELQMLPTFLKENGIVLVHLNMHVLLGPLLASRQVGLPVVVHYRAKTNDRPKLFFNLFLPWLYLRASKIVCISHAVARHFYSRNLKEKVEVVPNPVDLGRFSKTKMRASMESERKKILYVGRVHPQKRIHLFLDAVDSLARKRSDLTCLLVGGVASDPEDQAYAARLREKSDRLAAPVEWVGHQKNVESYMQSSSVLILPSVNEGFGRVLVEGMASGIPVVGANSGAIPEVLDGGRWGQLVPPDNADKLEEAIARALDDPAWKEVAGRAVGYAEENFSVEVHASKLTEIYDRLLS